MESLTVPGTLDSLSRIGDYAKAAASEANLERKAAYKLRLAVDEIATNIITHGYEEAGRTGTLELSTEIDDEKLTMYIEDTGSSYEPPTGEKPDSVDQPLEDRAIGGLGLYLSMQSVDEFRYVHEDGLNRHTLVMYRNAEAGQGGTGT